MRRITLDAIAKKCAQFCHRTWIDLNHPEVRLINERGRLKHMAGALGHVPPRQPAELVMDERYQQIQRSFVAPPPRQ